MVEELLVLVRGDVLAVGVSLVVRVATVEEAAVVVRPREVGELHLGQHVGVVLSCNREYRPLLLRLEQEQTKGDFLPVSTFLK